jgi:hypothetical protein
MQDSNIEVLFYGIVAFLVIFIPTVWVILKVKRKVLGSKYRRIFLTIVLTVPFIFMLIGGIGSLIDLLSVISSPPVPARIVARQEKYEYRSLGRNYTVKIKEPFHQYANKPLSIYANLYYDIGDTITIRVSSNGKAIGSIWLQIILTTLQILLAFTFYKLIRITLNTKTTKTKSLPKTKSDITRTK